MGPGEPVLVLVRGLRTAQRLPVEVSVMVSPASLRRLRYDVSVG